MADETKVEEQPVRQAQQSQPQSKQRAKDKIRMFWERLKKFGRECQRVMKVIQKPNKEEFVTTAKVSALGLTAVGLIGFVLSMIQQAFI